MAKTDVLNPILSYIEEHIKEPLTLTGIASQAGYSPYHFSRMFSVIMGVPVMNYVRARKIAHALVALEQGQKVIDVAMEYGFSSHEVFTRAFKQIYGVPPRTYLIWRNEPYTLPPVSLMQNERLGEKKMECKLVERPAKKVFGYLLHTTPGSQEIPVFWQEIMKDDRWDRLCKKAQGENYGLCIHPKDMPEGKMDYMVAFDGDDSVELDADMVRYTIPAATYATFVCKDLSGSLTDGIRATWQYIYQEWFPTSGYTYDGDKPDFEVYDSESGCAIYIPVVKK